jgi:hypothetical protein
VSQDLVTAPTARSWREIAQPVKPRAMSREGKWRRWRKKLRITGAVAVIAGVVWGSWEVGRSVMGRPQPSSISVSDQAASVKHLELRTDGVLDTAWLAKTLALPKNATLMDLDLQALRVKLMAGGQVLAASLTKNFPDTLKVQVTERSPVVRLMADLHGAQTALLVARDGVVFDGACYEPESLASLPWLDGIRLGRTGDKYDPVKNMGLVAELLGRTRLDAEHLYRTWQVVSLARLHSDGEIQVRTKGGTLIVFGAQADFFQQIARLDHQWDTFAGGPMLPAKIDLSLGSEVSVSFPAPPLAAIGANPAARVSKSTPAPAFGLFPHSQPKPKP